MKKGFENKLSFMALLLEADEKLKGKGLPKFIEGSMLEHDEKVDVLEFIFSNNLESIDERGIINIGDTSFDIINASIEQGSLFLWLWSDSLDEEKILRIDITAGFVDSNPIDNESNDED